MSQPWHERWVHPKDSVIIITGARSGIGMAPALLAAQQGYQVAAWDVSAPGVQKTIHLAGVLSSSIHPIICDIADQAAVKDAMEQTVNIGKPHMLVNNAGPVAIGKEADFMEMMNAAMGMNHFITSEFLETKPVEGSSIVNISSIVGPIFGGGKYPLASICHVGAGMRPQAIAGYSRNLAVELKGHTRVNTVAPGGPVRTPRNAAFIDRGVFNKVLDRNRQVDLALQRNWQNGIMFLLSPAASYINGHMLSMDGGLSIAE